jgi:DNA-binding NtrC family response regulator
VEDEPLVAEHIVHVLTEAEAEVVGPFASVLEARQLVRNGVFVNAALLDLNLRDGSVTPLLESLAARGIPTLVYTGAGLPDVIRRRHPQLIVLTKPVPPARLVGEIRRATRNGPGPSPK